MKTREGLLSISTFVNEILPLGTYKDCHTNFCRQVIINREIKRYWDTLQQLNMRVVLYVPFWTPQDIENLRRSKNVNL